MTGDRWYVIGLSADLVSAIASSSGSLIMRLLSILEHCNSFYKIYKLLLVSRCLHGLFDWLSDFDCSSHGMSDYAGCLLSLWCSVYFEPTRVGNWRVQLKADDDDDCWKCNNAAVVNRASLVLVEFWTVCGSLRKAVSSQMFNILRV